ncbi:glycosyltransferase [Euzebyella marina]|nr:glycosyltransferase [Euzebyella marina]
MKKDGHDSRFLFLEKGSESKYEIKYSKKLYLIDLAARILKKMGLPPNLEQSNDFKIRRFKKKFEYFSFANTSYIDLPNHEAIQHCDIINLHFVANFIDVPSFFKNIKKPIVWTLHDMNPFQGGFHYKLDEKAYAFQLNGLDDEQYDFKRRAFKPLSKNLLTIVTPSFWMYQKSKDSQLLRKFSHFHISNGIDTEIFKPLNKKECAKSLEMSTNKPIVLFVAESLRNKRKGFNLVLDLVKDPNLLLKYHFVAVGEVQNSRATKDITFLGRISDEVQMSKVYNAADFFILPSIEDNLPNTMIESLCCGTPVVGFEVGGIKETITNGENGFLSKEITVDGLKKALLNCDEIGMAKYGQKIAENARLKFQLTLQTDKYIALYNSLVRQLS